MRFLKIFLNWIPMIISLIPFILMILALVLVVFMIKNKVKIKFRTFKGKGFRPVRGNFGLYTYCGKQGKGKTYSLVEYLIDNNDKISVFNNIAGVKNVSYVHFTGFKELLDIKNMIDFRGTRSGFYDELYEYILSLGWDSSRAKLCIDLFKDLKKHKKQLIITYDEIFTELLRGSKLSKDVIDFLCQMRKRGIIFLTTCQEWAELPLPFRRFCRYQIDCEMYPFLWTGFLVKTFKDAENMKWSNDEQEHIAPIVETTITKCRKYIANSYDTYLRISSVNAPSSTGASTTPPVEEESESSQNLQTE